MACPECGRNFANNPKGLHTHRRNSHGIRGDEFAMRIKAMSMDGRKEYGRKYRDKKRRQADRMAMKNLPDTTSSMKEEKKTHAHFCPKCGTNIDAINMALKITS